MITTDFKYDFDFFINKIKNFENFTLSLWGDGELMILEGTNIDIRNKGNGEFRYQKGDELSELSREYLKTSYAHVDDNYYIGIACKCCVGDDKFDIDIINNDINPPTGYLNKGGADSNQTSKKFKL